MYLGALVLLYRQLLVATAETQQTDGTVNNPNFSTDDARRYRNECAVAAQNIARILALISYDGTLTRRCWLIIYWSFSSAVVLLFSATTKLVDSRTDGVEMDLKYAKACINMLEPCRSFEPIAARYLDTLAPLYDYLRDVYQRMVGRSKTSIFALLQADPGGLSPPVLVSKQEMGPILEKLAILLTDPFGRKQCRHQGVSTRRLLSANRSCSVFWWN